MSWHTDVTGHGAGNPETRSEGTGTLRVDNVQPVPLPQRTLPVTRAGFATRDNHYLRVSVVGTITNREDHVSQYI